MSEVFNLAKFVHFCKHLKVDTKEHGVKPLGKFLGTQKFLLQEIDKGLKMGQHKFIVLKGRQQGISTISQALIDLYWPFVNPGMQGSLISDNGANLNNFRTILKIFYEGLPEHMKIKKVTDNIYQVVFENRSSVTYQVANKRSKGTLGRGIATNFLHATEISSWNDEEGVASLVSSLAEHNPRRLYLFESTARGFNIFWDMWESAKSSEFERAIFIGWWRSEYNCLQNDDARFTYYWDGHLTTTESEWVEEVKVLYDYDITANQVAWFRWKRAEEILDDSLMFQEYPPTEAYAFQMVGSAFFSPGKLRQTFINITERPPEADYYKFNCANMFELTTLARCAEEKAEYTVWEKPVDEGHYVLGCDPAYGSSENADRHCISVWRCYADKMEQVAEYCTPEGNAQQFAWILATIAGQYAGCIVNLEINGPGGVVLNELFNLQRIAGPRRERSKDIYDIVGNIRHYLYRRIDTMGGGFAYQFNTNFKEKERMFGFMRGYFEHDTLIIRSSELVREMGSIVRRDGSLAASGRGKDDRVVAAGLAVICFNDKKLAQLSGIGLTYDAAKFMEGTGKPLSVPQTLLRTALDRGYA